MLTTITQPSQQAAKLRLALQARKLREQVDTRGKSLMKTLRTRMTMRIIRDTLNLGRLISKADQMMRASLMMMLEMKRLKSSHKSKMTT